MLDWKYRPKSDGERAAETEQKAKAEQEREETPEGFASKNAKTITFTVMVALFLAFFGPVTVFQIYKHFAAEADARVDMTQTDLVSLGKIGESLTMDHLRGYTGTENENEERITYLIRMDGYILNAVQEKGKNTLSVCLLTDSESGDSIDIRYEDVEAFLASH